MLLKTNCVWKMLVIEAVIRTRACNVLFMVMKKVCSYVVKTNCVVIGAVMGKRAWKDESMECVIYGYEKVRRKSRTHTHYHVQ